MASTGEPAKQRRRRRRRRGRRGGRDREQAQAAEQHQTGFRHRGRPLRRVPDEIDTTPSDRAGMRPGAPSAPVWSLQDDMPDTTPQDERGQAGKKGWWQRTFSGE